MFFINLSITLSFFFLWILKYDIWCLWKIKQARVLDSFLKYHATVKRLGTYIFLSVDYAKTVLLAFDLFKS